jgi:S-formylglutathione hydrolase FrmB
VGLITVFQTNGTGSLSDYIDWADGSHHNEDTYLRLFTWVDAHYRTIPDRLHRALGGVSAGAYGAFTIAAHHAQMFGQIGSISGPWSMTNPGRRKTRRTWWLDTAT